MVQSKTQVTVVCVEDVVDAKYYDSHQPVLLLVLMLLACACTFALGLAIGAMK